MPCLSDVTLADFLAGHLSGAELARVDAELDSCANCRRTLVALAQQSIGSKPTDGEHTMLPIGSVLGQYHITGVLGRGGGGVVYAAQDSELKRRVAIKVLHPSVSRRQRVVAEAQAMARLSHPNVVTVYEFGEAPSVGFYLALELVEGQTLADFAATRPGWRSLLSAYMQAGKGLAAAHHVGLVHRDFKPHNVLIDSTGRARVTDFGLARAPSVSSQPLGNAAQDQTVSAIAGTPVYMAPEQLDGVSATTRSDQYSFCKALFCALYNQPAKLWVDTPGSTPKSSERVPRWLWPILRRGLRVDPNARYPNMDSLLSALGRHQRNRVRVSAVATVAVITGIGIGSYAKSNDSQQLVSCDNAGQKIRRRFGPQRLAELKLALASAKNPNAQAIASRSVNTIASYANKLEHLAVQTCEATYHKRSQSESLHRRQKVCIDDRLMALESLSTALAADQELAEKAIQASLALQSLDACTDRVTLLASPELPQDQTTRAQIEAVRKILADGRVQRDLANYPNAVQLAEEALSVARKIGHKPSEAVALFLVAEVRGRMGSPAEVKEQLYKAAFAAEEARDDLTAAQVWIKLIFHTGARLQQFDEAYRLSQHARAAILRIGGSALLESKRLYAHAAALHDESRYAEAEKMLRRSLELIESELEPNDPDTAAVVGALAMALSSQGKMEEALDFSLRSLAMRKASLGPNHPDVASSHNNLGAQLGKLGRYKEAETHLQRALEIVEDSLGPTHIHVAYTVDNLGELALLTGDAATALTHHRRAQSIVAANKGPDHTDLAYPALGEGKALNQLARYQEAELALERTLRLFPNHPDPRVVAEIRMALATSINKRGAKKRAHAIVHTAIRDLKAIPEPELVEKAEKWLLEH